MCSECYATILLAIDIWREDRGGLTHASRVGVGWVVRNRATHPKWWGRTIVEVITHRWQFSSMTAPGDPNLIQWPQENTLSWKDSEKAAEEVIGKDSIDPTMGATFYYSFPLTSPPAAWGDVVETAVLDGIHFCKPAAIMVSA